jgi:hypothetical protein
MPSQRPDRIASYPIVSTLIYHYAFFLFTRHAIRRPLINILQRSRLD